MARRAQPKPADLPLGITPRTLVVTGKGGVGKSTVAAALALAYRDAGVRTLLVGIHGQSDAAKRISNRNVGYDAIALSPGLHAMCIDSDAALREYAQMRLKVKAVSDRLARNPIVDQFAQAAPGFRELLVLGKLWWLNEQKDSRGQARYEAIIVDAPATGHGLSFLSMAGVIAKAFPIGPIAAQANAVDAFVRDADRVGAVLVALAEEIPVNETIDLFDQLGERKIAVSGVITNAVIPARFSPDECEVIERLMREGVPGDDGSITATLAAASRELHRSREQASELERLESHLGQPTRRLPFVPNADLTIDDISAAAVALRGPTRGATTPVVRTTVEVDA